MLHSKDFYPSAKLSKKFPPVRQTPVNSISTLYNIHVKKDTIEIQVNGQSHTLNIDRFTTLLSTLRNELGLYGAKYGCGLKQCGACMVIVGGEATQSCSLTLDEIQGREITTLEGLSEDDPLISAFIAHDAGQCGYCIPGMIMAATSLLAWNDEPNENEIRRALEKNLCRCGAHPRILAAIRSLGEKKQ